MCSVLAAFLKGMFAFQMNSDTPLLSGSTEGKPSSLEKELLLQAWNEDSSESDEGRGYADPIQDDLYTRRVLQTTHQTSVNMDSDKFLPKYWTPEEDAHVGKIRLGSQRRPWYKKMQGFRLVRMVECFFIFVNFFSWILYKRSTVLGFSVTFYPPLLVFSFSPSIPGFSQKTSGSSEEDSDFDVTPWLGAPAHTYPPTSRSERTFNTF